MSAIFSFEIKILALSSFSRSLEQYPDVLFYIIVKHVMLFFLAGSHNYLNMKPANTAQLKPLLLQNHSWKPINKSICKKQSLPIIYKPEWWQGPHWDTEDSFLYFKQVINHNPFISISDRLEKKLSSDKCSNGCFSGHDICYLVSQKASGEEKTNLTDKFLSRQLPR